MVDLYVVMALSCEHSATRESVWGSEYVLCCGAYLLGKLLLAHGGTIFQTHTCNHETLLVLRFDLAVEPVLWVVGSTYM
jgi:hypothetical protein